MFRSVGRVHVGLTARALSCAAAGRGQCLAQWLPPSQRLKWAAPSRHVPSALHACLLRRCGDVARATASSDNTATFTPLQPLFERQPVAEVPCTHLARWVASAREAVDALGPQALQTADDVGASSSDLLLELDWLLCDAVAAWRESPQTGEWRSGPDIWRSLRRSGSLQTPEAMAWLHCSLAELDALWRKRLHDRVPLQYLTACQHWHDVTLAVGPGVLIPRPETEGLLQLAAQAMAASPHILPHGRWADVGTGSGALAVCLARMLAADAPPVDAVDVCPTALAYTAANAHRLGVTHRVRTHQGSWLQPVLAQSGGAPCLDGVLSNPPYVPATRIPSLQPEVNRHEPKLALDGGPDDGSAAIMQLIRDIVQALRPGGFVALETDGGAQAHTIAAAFEDTGAFERVSVADDCYGRLRFVSAWKTSLALHSCQMRD